MATLTNGRKITIIYVLQILQKYSDSNHTMTQLDIMEKLKKDYDIVVDRGTIKRNIMELIDAGLNIQFKEIVRTQKNRKTGISEENSIYTDIYFEHEFTESELHLIIDGLLFSRSVPYSQRKKLIEKLGTLSNAYFSRKMSHIHCMSPESPQNPELFHTIEILDDAISNNRQVEITYNHFGTDFKLHPTKNEDGNDVKRHILNPYQMVAKDGRYYLICNNDHHEAVGSYRIDRITNIKLLDTVAKPKSKVKGLENGLNIQDHIFQNIDMFVGTVIDVEFLVDKKLIGVMIDFFGTNISFGIDKGDTILCRIKASDRSIRRWATMFANTVTIVSPKSLVEEIRSDLNTALQKYSHFYQDDETYS